MSASGQAFPFTMLSWWLVTTKGFFFARPSRNIYHAGNRSMSHDNIGALPRDNTPERPAPAGPERCIGNLQPIREMIYLQSLVASRGYSVPASGRDHCDLPVLGVLQAFRYLVGVLFQAPAARLEIRSSDQ